MSFRIVVLAKQVPDTRNVGKDAMKEESFPQYLIQMTLMLWKWPWR